MARKKVLEKIDLKKGKNRVSKNRGKINFKKY